MSSYPPSSPAGVVLDFSAHRARKFMLRKRHVYFEGMLFSESSLLFFFDMDEVADFMAEKGCSFDSLQLVLCEDDDGSTASPSFLGYRATDKAIAFPDDFPLRDF